MKKAEFYKLASLFLLWRIFLFVISYSARFILPYQPSFPYFDTLANYHLPQFIYSWANFDGVHYLTIIQQGYFGTGLIQAFFPLFPLLAKFLNLFVGNTLLSGLLISNLFAFLSLIFFYLLLKEYGISSRFKVLLIYLLFPTSFYLVALYSESLFLTLVFATLYLAKKQHWLLAGILAGLASATRIVGIALLPVLFLELFLAKKISLKNILALSLSVTGLSAYMFYLQFEFQDFLYFLHLQDDFGAGRQENLILYPQVVWRYLKILYTARPFDWKYFAYVQEFAAAILGLIYLTLSSLSYCRRGKTTTKVESGEVDLSLILFSALSFLVPTLTGTFSSLPRYLLACPAIYLTLNPSPVLRRGKLIGVVWLFLSTVLLVINLVLFIQGYWVA